MAARMTLEDLDRLKEILGPSKPMIGNDDDPVVVVNATQWLVLATDIGKITRQRDRLLSFVRDDLCDLAEALPHVPAPSAHPLEVRRLVLIAECEGRADG